MKKNINENKNNEYKFVKEAGLTLAVFALVIGTALFAINIVVGELLRMASGQTIWMIEANVDNTFTSVSLAFDSNMHFLRDKINDEADSEQLLEEIIKISNWLVNSNHHKFYSESAFYGYYKGEFLDGAGWVPDEDYDPTSRPWHISAVEAKGEIALTTPYVDAQTGEVITSCSQEIYNKDGESIGVLAIDAILADLFDYFHNLHEQENVQVILMDDNFNISIHSDTALSGKHLSDYSPEFYHYIKSLEDKDSVIVKNAKIFDGNEQYVFSLLQIENGWYIATVVPNSKYYQNSYIIMIIMIMFGLVGYSVTVYILYNLNTQRKIANEASKSKSDFLANMSHEIRTPMNAIIGISQIRLQNEDLPDEYASDFHRIYNSGSNLLGIINDILDMSKIEKGKLELSPINYDVPSLINDAVQLNIVRIGSKPLEFLLDVDENVPLRFIGDELRLKQILNNLLSNAIKYTEKGYVKLSVSHTAHKDDYTLRFIVEDTGQGLKPEDLKKLFLLYSRFNTVANRATEGAGLGLSIAKRLIEMMEGTIHVDSKYGKGSKFIVEVKQGKIECPVIGKDLSERLRNFTFINETQTAEIKISCEPMPYGKVLVVDDVETNLYVAAGLMKPYRLNVETANSGYKAIELVENGNTYDVIFMDHMMPLMDGVETTKKLRELGYTGSIFALTANALVGNDEMFIQNGFDGFVAKPINVRHLNEVLNKTVRDGNPDEAKKYVNKSEETASVQPFCSNPKILQVFCRDAEKAIVAFEETLASGDIKLYTTTAHAMKSALANVGEYDASKLAQELENAGLKNDKGFISASTENFINVLKSIIQKINPNETVTHIDEDIVENLDYLIEQLTIIKTACEDYDDTTAYAAFDKLKDKRWKKSTIDLLEEINDMLFSNSDFDGATQKADFMLKNINMLRS